MKYIFLFLTHLIYLSSYSQSIDRSAVGGSFVSYTDNESTLDLSTGGLAISTLQTKDQTITQGFLQPTLNYTIIFDKKSICIGDSLFIKTSHGKSHHWTNDNDEVLSIDPSYKYLVTDSSSNINLKINNSVDISRPIILKEAKECPVNLLIYQLLTPNGDDQNDVFFIKGLKKAPNHEITIINKWGNEVFFSTSYKNDWTGEKLSDGTYIYIVKDLDREKTYTNKLIVKR